MTPSPRAEIRVVKPKRPPESRPHAEAAPAPIDLNDPSLYLNRDLSWLKFNARVLMQARDDTHPLLERVKFAAIAASNLDEFYMVRVAALRRQHRAGVGRISADGLDVEQQFTAVRHAADSMLHDIGRDWLETLRPALASEGIRFLEPDEYTPAVQTHLAEHFNMVLCPVLTPLAVDPAHPFPYIANRSLNLVVVVRYRGETRFAIVKVPNSLPRFVEIPPELVGGRTAFVFLEDVITSNLRDLFPGVRIVSAHSFRVLRDGEIPIPAGHTDDLMETVERGLRAARHRPLSLLQIDDTTPQRVADTLVENFDADSDVVVRSPHRLGFVEWLTIARLTRPALRDTPLRHRVFWRRASADDIFERLKYQDVLIHHPYDAFGAFENFLRSAVRDPKVLAIKMTLYRVGTTPPVVDLLLEAADRGKQVAVLVELKARFEERQNIEWATRLEEAGVHVTYGLLDLKTHGKACLIVRSTTSAIERYAHLATGNYNPVTASLYTDFGLFTSDPRIVADLSELFNVLTGYSNQVSYRELAVAPVNFRRRLRMLVSREVEHAQAGRPAGIVIKVNSLTDPGFVRELYRASQAGVPIDLIVRGMCVLRPGVPGVSETIRVRSIVGRFLEHSRVFSFENGGAREVYLSSADLRERNLNHRVEILWPVRDATFARYLREVVLDAYLRDTRRAMVLGADGDYDALPGRRSHRAFDAQLWLARHLPPHSGKGDDTPEVDTPSEGSRATADAESS